MTRRLFIGVDGGGSGCRVAIATQTETLATATGASANVSSDFEGAIESIANTLTKAAEQAGLIGPDLTRATAHLGLAGVMTPAQAAQVAAQFSFAHITVSDDRPTALHGALGGVDGAYLGVGTGMFAAMQAGGEFKTLGGWGLALGDQASGAWLGQSALRRVMMCHDGLAEHSDLTHALLAHFNGDPNAVVTFATTADPSDFADFAPDITKAAQAGDVVALGLMQSGATHLTKSLAALGFATGTPLALGGGLGAHYAPYLSADILSGRVDIKGSPLDGALALARQATT